MVSPYQKAVNQYRRDEADKRVMNAIRQYMAQHEYAPTIRDICAITGDSVGTVHKVLLRLERNEQIARARNAARTIRLVNDVHA